MMLTVHSWQIVVIVGEDNDNGDDNDEDGDL
jgi:hypothetical protein